MIQDGSFRLTGLKQRDITQEIENIIDNAQEFILICGYSFTNHRNPRSILRKVIDSPIRSKHCILPINLYRGQDANRIRAIELIKNGVSVSIENKNHSKWVMSEMEIYYGSANFSLDSLENKIEVASFKNFQPHDLLRSEFCQFVIDSMGRMMHLSHRNSIKGVIRQNNTLTSLSRPLIQRFNPSIEKVEATIDAVNNVRSYLFGILENSYWYLNNERYNALLDQVWRLDSIVNNISFKGLELLNTKEKSIHFKRRIYYYNKECDKFLNRIPELSDITKDYIFSEKKVPFITTKNRKLVRYNHSVLMDIFEINSTNA